jgi:hypothetical protein
MKSAHSRRHGQGRGPRTMTAAHHLTAVLAVGVARLSPSNRISANPPNAPFIVAIERRPPNVDISGPVSANSGRSLTMGNRSNRPPADRRGRQHEDGAMAYSDGEFSQDLRRKKSNETVKVQPLPRREFRAVIIKSLALYVRRWKRPDENAPLEELTAFCG